jgi:threonine/homoserine/homoserine lactone efflux protein
MLALLIFAFVTGLSGALMPGPLLAVTISEAARMGFWAGPLVVAGHGALELALIVALVLGLNRILAKPLVFGLLGVVGAAILTWMAWGMLHPSAQDIAFVTGLGSGGVEQAGAGTFWRPIGLGVWTSVANVYWVVWWGTFGMTLISRALQHGRTGLGVFWVGHVSSDLVWYTAVAAAVALGHSIFKSGAVYRGVLAVCGVALLGLAVYFGYSGVRALLRRQAPTLGSEEPAA